MRKLVYKRIGSMLIVTGFEFYGQGYNYFKKACADGYYGSICYNNKGEIEIHLHKN